MEVIVKFAVYKYKEHPRWQIHYRIVFDPHERYFVQRYDSDYNEWSNNSRTNRYETLDLLYKSKEFQKLFNVL